MLIVSLLRYAVSPTVSLLLFPYIACVLYARSRLHILTSPTIQAFAQNKLIILQTTRGTGYAKFMPIYVTRSMA